LLGCPRAAVAFRAARAVILLAVVTQTVFLWQLGLAPNAAPFGACAPQT
jgi:hypothetical protein